LSRDPQKFIRHLKLLAGLPGFATDYSDKPAGRASPGLSQPVAVFLLRQRCGSFDWLYSIEFIGYYARMISQKARYALRALLFLAARGDTIPVQISEIAESERIPRKFLEAILLELKKTGIVRSHRGRSGGYSLGRPAKDISFADVLRVTDGPLALSPCVSVMAYRKCDDCFEESVCAIRKALLAARDATAQILESRNLAAAAQQLRRSGAL
jgi:Rrf2 family protein